MRKLVLSVLCAAALGGCGSHGISTLSASPQALEDCGAASIPAKILISWDASQSKEKGIKIWVSDGSPLPRTGIWGGNPHGTLWVGGELIGSANTDQWMKAGSHLIMTDNSGDDILAELTIKSLPCKN